MNQIQIGRFIAASRKAQGLTQRQLAVNLGKVVGADGKDGLTPFIGENGNWWIGEKDTGVKAAADAAIPAGSGNISESAASPALIAVGIVAGIALLGNLGLILYIVLKKKNSLV